MIDDLAVVKADLRKHAFAARKVAHADRTAKDPKANAALFTEVSALAGTLQGRIIATYQAMRTEIDPEPAATLFVAAGARLCTPVIIGAGQALKFREWSPGATMTNGEFGAKIPVAGEWLIPDIVIAPLVGWDRTGARLGYGGGFYDRSLEALRAVASTPAIGFAYAAQEVPKAPQEPTDQPLTALVTERETIRFGELF